MYGNGEGVSNHDAVAVKWYKLAADQGLVEAQTNLGLRYSTGEGVPQNNIKTYVWWSVSAGKGDEDAKNNREIVAAKLTPQDLSKAQSIATKCFESNYKDCELGWFLIRLSARAVARSHCVMLATTNSIIEIYNLTNPCAKHLPIHSSLLCNFCPRVKSMRCLY